MQVNRTPQAFDMIISKFDLRTIWHLSKFNCYSSILEQLLHQLQGKKKTGDTLLTKSKYRREDTRCKSTLHMQSISYEFKQVITTNTKSRRKFTCTSCGPASLRKVAFVCAAQARAMRVFPVPGGPYKRTPFGGRMPNF